tara:strand:- start:73 stop:639 length:567 start_codon:yes stop_codon:yes gene_type:complete
MAKDSSFSAPFPNRTKKHARKKRHAKKTQEEEDDAAAAPRYDAPRPTRRRSIVLRLVSKSLSLRERERERTERSLVLGGKKFLSLKQRRKQHRIRTRKRQNATSVWKKREKDIITNTQKKVRFFASYSRNNNRRGTKKQRERRKKQTFFAFLHNKQESENERRRFFVRQKKNQTLHKIGVLYIHTYSV